MRVSSIYLLVNIGNTNAIVAVAEKCRILRRISIPSDTRSRKDIDGVVRRVMGKDTVGAAVLCSVVPSVVNDWKGTINSITGRTPLCVNHSATLGLKLSYPTPSSIGHDRLANACGAAAKYKAPFIVIDVGTAATFDLVCPVRGFIGGAIAPGPRLMTDYLAERTALLPQISITERIPLAGRSTIASMQIGTVVGYRGLTREVVQYLKTKTAGFQDATVCITGGYARWVVKSLRMPFVLDPDLTLRGLYHFGLLNGSRAYSGELAKHCTRVHRSWI